MGRPPSPRARFRDGLYLELLHEGVHYFFPGSHLEEVEAVESRGTSLTVVGHSGGEIEFEWLGIRLRLSKAAGDVTQLERALLAGIGRVLGTRYVLHDSATPTAQVFHLFRGLPEDRYISAFLEELATPGSARPVEGPDRITDAIEVLRASALGTYENRRIAMGALLFGARPDPCHELPPRPAGAVRYDSALTSIRSFRRLCDGLQTVALVNTDGLLVEIVDVRHWAQPFAEAVLPIPCATPFQAHARATLCGGHLCFVLTPHGEIKVFAEGVQVFSFLDGRWRLTDPVEKYRAWANAVEDPVLAERLFSAALNLAEERRGALIVVLNDPRHAHLLMAPEDLLATPPRERKGLDQPMAKRHLHYLFRDIRVLDLTPSIAETLARIDGAVVLDRRGELLSFGAILRHPVKGEYSERSVEGGRTTAAIAASRFGNAIKVSEDGMVSYFSQGRCVWEL